MLCPIRNNLGPIVISTIRLTKTLDCLQRQTSPLSLFWALSVSFSGVVDKHTNMYQTSFSILFFGLHHKITNASSTFSYTSSATNKSTSTTTKPGWGGEPTLSFETCELSWQQNIQEFSFTLDLTTRELLTVLNYLEL